MKKSLYALLLLFVASQTIAQNLVTNNSFENYSSCPFSTSSIGNVTGWIASLNSPDYFNVCANTNGSNVGVPANVCGFQYPASGDGYIGLLGYGSFSSSLIPDTREYATGTLSQPLTIGVKYYVSFKVALMNASSHAVDHIGAKFLLSPFTFLQISNNSQVHSSVVVTDTLLWTNIQGSFIADSNYAYISIGNHYNDANTTVLSIQPITFGYNAYYFIDNVCVSSDSATCSLPVGIYEHGYPGESALFPNPFSDKLNIRTGNSELSEIVIYDIASRQLLQKKFINMVSLNTGQLAKGIYIYEVRNKNVVIKNGKVVKE